VDSVLSDVRLGGRMLRLVPSVFFVRKASSILLYFFACRWKTFVDCSMYKFGSVTCYDSCYLIVFKSVRLNAKDA
jgi:hypothetical protein